MKAISRLAAGGILLAMCATSGLLPLPAEADQSADQVYYAGEYGYTLDGTANATIVEYNGSDAVLMIPSSLGGYPVVGIGKSAFTENDVLTSVTIPEGVQLIDMWAFDNCSLLKAVSIPGSVKTIEYSAFTECVSLQSVDLSEGIASIQSCSFSGCKSLPYIYIPRSVTHIGANTFLDCDLLEVIEVSPDNPIYAVVDGVLFDVSAHQLVIYPNAKKDAYYEIPSGIESIGLDAFAHNGYLNTVVMPNTVIEIGKGAFLYCRNLASLAIPDSVTTIGEAAFADCTNLVNVDLPANIESIDGFLFYGAENLASIAIPDGVIRIGEKAFCSCENLSNVTIPDSVTSIDEAAFRDCINLASLKIPDSVTYMAHNSFFHCNKLVLSVAPSSYAEAYAQTNKIPYATTNGIVASGGEMGILEGALMELPTMTGSAVAWDSSPTEILSLKYDCDESGIFSFFDPGFLTSGVYTASETLLGQYFSGNYLFHDDALVAVSYEFETDSFIPRNSADLNTLYERLAYILGEPQTKDPQLLFELWTLQYAGDVPYTRDMCVEYAEWTAADGTATCFLALNRGTYEGTTVYIMCLNTPFIEKCLDSAARADGL